MRAGHGGSCCTRRPTRGRCTRVPGTGRAVGYSWSRGSSTSRWRSACSRQQPLGRSPRDSVSAMAEVRIDPLSGQRVFIATDEVTQIRSSSVGRRAGGRRASSRSSTAPPSRRSRRAYPDLFWAGAATGTHELLEVEEPVRSLGELAPERVAEVMEGWRARMRTHGDAACLHLFSDEQPGMRASAQLLALEFVPALIARERERFRGYATRTMGGNLLADLLQNEVRLRAASGGRRRRGGAAVRVRGAGPVSADDRAADAADAVRGRRTDRGGDAARRVATARCGVGVRSRR